MACPGISALCTPNSDLAAIVGAAPAARGDLIKKFWAYVNANGLKNGQKINCDAKIKKIAANAGITTDVITMFQVMSIIGKNISK